MLEGEVVWVRKVSQGRTESLACRTRKRKAGDSGLQRGREQGQWGAERAWMRS